MTIDFSAEHEHLLRQMSKSLGTTKVAVLRHGLTLLALTIRESERGRGVGIIEGDKVVREFVGDWSLRLEAMA